MKENYVKNFTDDFKDISALKEMLSVPANKYRVYPICHSLCDPDANYMDQVDNVKASGAGGIVTNTTWTVPEWVYDENNTKKLKDAVDYIKQNGMQAWMYDDYAYPSGLANGYAVQDHPEYLPESIDFIAVSLQQNDKYQYTVDDSHGEILFAAVYDDALNLVSKADIENNTVIAKDAGTLVIFYKALHREEMSQPVGKAKGHLNHLKREAVESFIEKGLKPVDDAVGLSNFDAIFTDEPTISHHVLSFKRGKVDFSCIPAPYGDKLFERYAEMWNESLPEKLLYLFTGVSEEARLTRVRYYKTVSFLARETYIDVIATWLKEKGTLASGHFLLEEGLRFHVGYYADFMRLVSGQDIPGCDVLCAAASLFFERGRGFETACAFGGKYVSSISRLKGHNVTMLEVCPVNWPEKIKKDPYKEFMGLSTYMIFAGITHYNAYGYFFITEEDKHNSLNTYVGRLLTVLRNSRMISPVGVYYPISQVQSWFACEGLTHPSEIDLYPQTLETENLMELLLETIYGKKTDFNIIDEDSLLQADITNIISKGLVSIETLIVPFVEIMPLSVAERLKQFKENGGKLIFIDKVPHLEETGKHEELQKIMAQLNAVAMPVSALNDMDLSADISFTVSGDDFYASPYELCGKKFMYVINLKEHDITVNVNGNAVIYVPEDNTWCKNTGEVTIKAERGIFVMED